MADGTPVETVVSFECSRSLLWGVVSQPPAESKPSTIAVVIIVGGPQYRVGSHRQFVALARGFARRGFAVLRFDYRGMGDSEGEPRTFDAVGADLQAAVDALCKVCPGTRRVVLWGLCDAASAALIFAGTDPRVSGIVAANPWARSEASLAAAQVKYYYGSRLLEREFWSRLIRGHFDWRASLTSLVHNLRFARAHYGAHGDAHPAEPFQTAMARGLAAFRGQTLLILSGNDLTAKEFIEYAAGASAWHGLLDDPKVCRIDVPEADHTFSRRVWLDRVEEETIAWLRCLEAHSGARTRPARQTGHNADSSALRSTNQTSEGA